MRFYKFALFLTLFLGFHAIAVGAVNTIAVTMGELSPESIRSLLAEYAARLQVPWPALIESDGKTSGFKYKAKFSNIQATRLFNSDSGQFVMNFEPGGVVRFRFQMPEANLMADLKLKAHVKGDQTGFSDLKGKYKATLKSLNGEVVLRVQVVDGEFKIQSAIMTKLKVGKSKFRLESENHGLGARLLNAFTFGELDTIIEKLMAEQVLNPRISQQFVNPVIQLLQNHLALPSHTLLAPGSWLGPEAVARVVSMETGHGVWKSLWQVGFLTNSNETASRPAGLFETLEPGPSADELNFRAPVALLEEAVSRLAQGGTFSFEKSQWGFHVKSSPSEQIKVKSISPNGFEIQIPLRIALNFLSTLRGELFVTSKIRAEFKQTDRRLSLQFLSAELSDFTGGKVTTALANNLKESLDQILVERAKEALAATSSVPTQIPVSETLAMTLNTLNIEPDFISGSICLSKLEDPLPVKE